VEEIRSREDELVITITTNRRLWSYTVLNYCRIIAGLSCAQEYERLKGRLLTINHCLLAVLILAGCYRVFSNHCKASLW
jgi:hypothetical protein